MATHDYNIANQTGADFRADLNNALLAIVSNNSNATSPSTTYAYQLWVDTANNVLKLRNSANSDWITTGISITASNSFTGDITGNSATATALATARTINGVSFDGTANISFNTDSVSEGSSNLYFTNERVDDQVNSLLTAGSGISLTYDDAAGTLTIANTNSADITSVVAGDGLTGGGTSGDVTLAVSVDDSSIEINSDTLRVKASGVTNAMLAGSIANSKLANSSVTINSQAIALGGSHTFDSDDIGEGSSNLYFTNARARGTLSIGSEGTASGNGAIAYNSSTGVFTYTPPVISGLTGDTDDLSEGSSNLYYTDARANSAIDARVTNTFINNLSGVVADTATALATARSISLSGDVTASGVNFDGTGDITLSTTIAANSVALGTDTTGNYVATVAGTTNEIEVSGSGSETATVTIGLPDNVTIAGNLTVNGTTTTVNTATLEVEDPLIKLAKANSGADSVDIGFYGLYDTSGSQDLYAGLFRDASDSGKFKLFKDLQPEPTTTVNTSGTGYAVGTLVSNLEGDVTGTIQTAAQPNITSLGTLSALTVTGEITANGGISLGDSDKATFGDSDDLQIYHDGSASYIDDAGTGNLRIRANGSLSIQKYTGETMGVFTADGSVLLAHDNSTKFETTSSGATVTGTLTATTLAGTLSTSAQPNITSLGTLTGLTTTGDINLGDNDKLRLGDSQDLEIYHDSSNSYIVDNGTGKLLIRGSTGIDLQSTAGEDFINMTENGAVVLRHDNSGKLTTTSSGVQIANTISSVSDLTLDVAGDIVLDADGADILFKDGGTQFGKISKGGGSDLIIDASIADKDIFFTGTDGSSLISALTLDMSNAGAATFNAGATFGNNVDVTGTVTANAGVVVDDITIDGTEIDLSSGDLTIDVAGDIVLDAAGQQIIFATGGTNVGQIDMAGTDLEIKSLVDNADLFIRGTDGGSEITALTFDMSAAGAATFNAGATFGGDIALSTSSYPKITLNDETGVDRQYSIGTSNETFVIRNETGTTDVIAITNDNKVGIGTSSPSRLLDIENSTAGGSTLVSLVSATDGNVQLLMGDTSSDTQGKVFYDNSSDFMSLHANGAERLRIDTTGVGIGTTSPDVDLHVMRTNTSASYNYATRYVAAFERNGACDVAIRAASSNASSLSFSDEADADVGRLLYEHSTNSMQFVVDASEAMRITDDHHVLLGTTTNQGVGGISFEHNSSTGYNIQQNMDGTSGGAELYVFRRNSVQIGSINQSGTTAVTYNTSSDARLKDVTGSSRGLDVINNLNPVAYNWKADNHSDEGLIAQEVEELVPNAVSQTEDGYYQMDYSKLVTHLVKGMQEQQEQIESLKSEIANLKGE